MCRCSRALGIGQQARRLASQIRHPAGPLIQNALRKTIGRHSVVCENHVIVLHLEAELVLGLLLGQTKKQRS